MQSNHKLLIELSIGIDSLDDIYELIDKSIADDPPLSIKEGELIKSGYDEELDELKKSKHRW